MFPLLSCMWSQWRVVLRKHCQLAAKNGEFRECLLPVTQHPSQRGIHKLFWNISSSLSCSGLVLTDWDTSSGWLYNARSHKGKKIVVGVGNGRRKASTRIVPVQEKPLLKRINWTLCSSLIIFVILPLTPQATLSPANYIKHLTTSLDILYNEVRWLCHKTQSLTEIVFFTFC